MGSVVDPTGAAVPNAKISFAASGQSESKEVVADSSGKFQLLQLPIGGYTVTAAAPGFASTRQINVPVEIGRATRIEFKLEVGQVSEQVVVAADAILVDSQSSASAVVVDKSFSDMIPKGRSFYDLIALAPGARPETKTGGVQVDGASGAENTFYLDGMEVTSIQTGELQTQDQVPVEMVEQTQIKNGVMEAQYGGAMGGVINAVLRSGNNQFHGQAGFYFDNDSLRARPRPTLRIDPFDDNLFEYIQTRQDKYSHWNPVFNIAGPILKNKLFFFAGYMPTFRGIDRDVTFESDGVTRSFHQDITQQYTVSKIDYNPFSQVRVGASWIWNPRKYTGNLPGKLGQDDPSTDWGALGDYYAGNMLAYYVDYTPTSRMVLSFRGGYHFNNHNSNYGISSDTSVYYSNTPPASLNVPENLIHPAGYVTYAPGATFFDAYKRNNYNADISYIADFWGQHTIKGGWQMNRLANQVESQTWSNGYYRYYWGLKYACVTSQCSGRLSGPYGYYRYRVYGEIGDVSSDNQALFLQDSWKVNSRLTLNLGIRTEREIVPSFATDKNIPSTAIKFPWSDKFSPRLGVAYDPMGDGKTRVYAGFGYFYDIMKYELPRGSFGGNIYRDYFYSLNDPNWVNTNNGIPADATKLQGTFYETVDWRIPANDPSDNTIDPKLKPMKQRMLDLGVERMIGSSLVASARYTNRRLIRTIEDVGTLGPDGEIYYIANPGFGITADPATWEPGIPVSPKAKRNYDAVEFRLDKRFSDRYLFAASYTWSRQYGNYSGLASSDEITVDSNGNANGRVSPNVNRYYDLPWIYYTEKGELAEGRLATDRPHTLKFFGGYSLPSKLGLTTLSPNFLIYSGTPLTSEIEAVSTTPVAPYGRGDLGRTPVCFNTDFNIMHDFKGFGANENMKVRFEFTVFNLFNGHAAMGVDSDMKNANDGQLQFDHDADIFKGFNARQLMLEQGVRMNPSYRYPNAFQNPRSARLQLSFIF
ncbi:MAG: TonB-dependent receptor [Bryobacterales bacterium]|nr:TonB-dependent receptor [Bryobacterales bacterium]